MLSFAINQQLTKKLKDLQSAVSAKYVEIKELPQTELDAIHRYARISMIGASTRIENAVLTDGEINWMDTILSADGKTTAFRDKKEMIEAKLSKDRERSIEEVAGCRAMLSIIYEQARDLLPFTESHLRGLHDELLRHYSKANHYRGKYKKSPNSVVERNHQTGEQREVLRTSQPGPITAAAMADLLAWYNRALIEEPWPVAVATEFVFRFLAIHPFQDGNGRVGRGLFLLCLLQCSDPHLSFISKYLAIDRQMERHKEDYYLVLNRVSGGKYRGNPKDYKTEHFLNFMIRVLMEALADIDHYREKHQAHQKLPNTALTVLSCFENQPETKLQMKEIEEKTKLPNRTILNALQTLQKKGFLQRYGQGRAVRYQIIF